jgi:hypothetical protein
MEGYKLFKDLKIGDYFYICKNEREGLEANIIKRKIIGIVNYGSDIIFYTNGLNESSALRVNPDKAFIDSLKIEGKFNYYFDGYYCTCDITCLTKRLKNALEDDMLLTAKTINEQVELLKSLHAKQKRLDEQTLMLHLDSLATS